MVSLGHSFVVWHVICDTVFVKEYIVIIKVIAGVVIGVCLGALMGHFGQCSSGTCPLTANPFRGAIYGGVMGALFAFSFANSSSRSVDKEKGDDTKIVNVQKDTKLEQEDADL